MREMNKFAKRFYDYVDTIEGYKCLTEYKNSMEKVTMLHEDCGNKYQQSPAKFLKGRRCHYCSSSRPLTKEILQKRLDTKFPNKFTIISDYKNSKTKIRVRNNYCSHEYEIKQQDLMSGKDCFQCHGSKKYTQEEFVEIFKEKGLKGFTVVGEYKGINNNIKIKHDKCGTEFDIKPSSYFKQFKKCPTCFTKSLGEERVADVLNDRKISYQREYRFDDCKYKYTLPFDFYLEEHNTCIEYQGKQHYQPVSEFGGNERYEYTKRNDNIKKQYCINNNIKLIEVPYWIDDVEKYIVEKIC